MAKNTDKGSVRPRAHGHRYADAVNDGLDIIAVGVRYDEDAPDHGESLVVRLRPGGLEPLGHCDGVARAVVLSHGLPCVLVGDGRLVRFAQGTATTVRDDVRDVAGHGDDALVLDAAGHVTALGAVTAPLGRVAGGTRVASDGRRVVVATAEGVFDIDGRRVLDRGGAAVAVAGSRIAIVDDGALFVVDDGDAAPGVFTVGHALHSVAVFAGRVFVGSRTAGLFVLVDGDERVRPLRPSLRARSLRVTGSSLAITSDLLVASTDDGDEFVTRDLAGVVRLADKITRVTGTEERAR